MSLSSTMNKVSAGITHAITKLAYTVSDFCTLEITNFHWEKNDDCNNFALKFDCVFTLEPPNHNLFLDPNKKIGIIQFYHIKWGLRGYTFQ